LVKDWTLYAGLKFGEHLICATYRRKTNSKFSVNKNDCSPHYFVEKIQRKASDMMEHFGMHDYTPEGLGQRYVDTAPERKSIRNIFTFPPSYPTAANRVSYDG